MSSIKDLPKTIWLVWRDGWSFPDIVLNEKDLNKYKNFANIIVREYKDVI